MIRVRLFFNKYIENVKSVSPIYIYVMHRNIHAHSAPKAFQHKDLDPASPGSRLTPTPHKHSVQPHVQRHQGRIPQPLVSQIWLWIRDRITWNLEIILTIWSSPTQKTGLLEAT